MIAIRKFVRIALFALPLSAPAASLSLDPMKISITLTGEIIPGDAERITRVFTAVKPTIPGLYLYPTTIYLNSPGGDVAEAIRIADLVKTLRLSVVTAPDGNGACASSCFLIYIGALDRRASGIDTLRIEGSKGNLGPIGIHRPSFRVSTGGLDGAEKQERIMSSMRTYLVKAGVGHILIDKMMAHASNDIYWLNAEEIRSLGRFPPGVEEQLIAKCGYNARNEASLSARDYIRSSQSGTLACVRNYMSKTYDPIRDNTIDRMRGGWRPWN